ncbi:hypothetical protein [Dokdonella sp.]|uniref:hypothetical protein n=1 Tax=Dokdonella sp. TaxID=2291710 RepID=UPI001B17E4A0|nr:hypothetical protein [Dokdonella sp.]MBO9664978.1 hypothetical protein [Dokdonella sp.]
MKSLLLALGLLALAPASAMDIDKDILQTRVLDAEGQPLGSLAISDLTPDGTFDGTGWRTADFNSADGAFDVGLRVFPSSDGGYWLTGYQTGASGARRLAIAKLKADGAYDTGYNGTGRKLIPSTMLEVTDVAKGTGDTFYFVGTQHTGSNTDLDIQVACIDGTGAPCSGFGSNGVKTVWLDLGSDPANKDERPNRIVWYASQLYIVGEVETDAGVGTTRNPAAFAINLNPASGARNLAFGNVPEHAGVFVYNPDYTPAGRDAAFDVLAYSPAPFAYRLVIVGERQRAPAGGDIDGFVLSVNGVTGQVDHFIDDAVYGDLGTSKQDAVTRIARRHNGGFVVAGFAYNDSATPSPQYELLLAAYHPDGTLDNDFGGGSSNMRHQLLLSGLNVPYGIAERADTRDLVVGINMKADLFGDGHPMQAVAQLGSTGTPLHAFAVLDFSANLDADKLSFGSDLIMDGDDVVTAGYRRWTLSSPANTSDFDMTIARFVANDTIFADSFGGATSD